MNILVAAWQGPCITIFSSGRQECPCHTASTLDKGGATVILNSEDYVAEALGQLDNTKYYKKVGRDFTEEHDKNIDECITTLAIKGNIERDTSKLLRPVNSRTPVIYERPSVKIDQRCGK